MLFAHIWVPHGGSGTDVNLVGLYAMFCCPGQLHSVFGSACSVHQLTSRFHLYSTRQIADIRSRTR